MAPIDEEIARSNVKVQEVVWPRISPAYGRGDLIVAVQEWDTDAGIDFFWKRGLRMSTLAARVQDTDDPFDTFTIRTMTAYGSRDTEWTKRHDAWTTDSLRPHYTLQAYVSTAGVLLSAAMCYSDALYELAFTKPWPEYKNVGDLSRFRAIPWSALPSDTIRVVRHPRLVEAS